MRPSPQERFGSSLLSPSPLCLSVCLSVSQSVRRRSARSDPIGLPSENARVYVVVGGSGRVPRKAREATRAHPRVKSASESKLGDGGSERRSGGTDNCAGGLSNTM